MNHDVDCGAHSNRLISLAVAWPVTIALLGLLACQGAAHPGQSAVGSAAPPAASTPAQPATADEALEPAPEPTPLPADLDPIVKPFTGDLDGMVKRRLIRVLTVQSPIFYFVDRGREVGIVYEAIKAFEKELNQQLGNQVVTVHVIAIPVARDQLIPRLLAGEGDIAAAALTITPERQRQVQFSTPTVTGVREVVVTGPDARPLTTVDELSGQEVYVRPSSSYAEHLRALNEHFRAQGRPPVRILPAPEILEDGDVLEMVNAGLVDRTVVDGYMADLYGKVFPSLRQGVAIGEPGDLGWAFRPGSPKLAGAVSTFLQKHGQGSLSRNVLLAKYLKTAKWVKNARSAEDRRRFAAMADVFRKYAARYRFDVLLMAAQGYQESGLDQQKRSPVGAIGVMQVMPATARDKLIGIPDIDQLESNIHAGIKYNRWMADNFFKDPAITPLNRQLFALASYNAGPGNVARLRKEAQANGLDPNVWFSNVELVAAKRIGRETVTYVANIYKYYLAYQMMVQASRARASAKTAAAH